MSSNEPPTNETESIDDHVSRRTVLKSAVAAGVTGLGLGATAGGASAHDLPHEIVLEARSDTVRYRIEVSGEIEKGPNASPGDEIRDDDVAVGSITEGNVDDYRFSGDKITVKILEGKVRIWINGERIDPDKLDDKDHDDKDDKDDKDEFRLSIHSEGPHVDYRFVVDGDVEPGDWADIGVGDEIDGDVVTGNVAGDGEDDYHIKGKITRFNVSRDDVTVKIDGEKVDPDDLGDRHHVSIISEGPHVDYKFVVDGDVEPGDRADIGVGDEIDGDVVTGNVAGDGEDNYWYTGEITDFDVSTEKVTIRIDDEEVDPDDVGD